MKYEEIMDRIEVTPEMRQRIRQVMAFSGPRMLLYHPGMAIWHLVCRLQNKRKRREE